MADRSSTYRTGLHFIDSNPATDAYQVGRALFEREYAQELQNEGTMVRNAEQLRGAPSRLRTLDATADMTRANADVAQGTVQPRIAQARSSADQAATGALVARETAPHTIGVARDNAAVSAGTVQPRIDSAAAGARGARANALTAELAPLYKTLDLLNAGRTEEATALARSAGMPNEMIQGLVQSAETRTAVTAAAKHAQEVYPSRPRDQQMFMQGFLKDMADRKAQGRPANDPTAMFNVPGAPQPPELATTTAQQAPADVKTAEWLVANGIAKTPAEAWQKVRLSRQNPDALRAQIFSRAATPAQGQRNWEAFLAAGRGATPAPAGGQPQYREGQTATNPQTGQKLIFRNGQWQPQ